MNPARAAAARQNREYAVLAVASGALILAQSIVFAALGLALYAMGQTLHLSAGAVGGAYTVQVIACCAAAIWPVPLIRWIGAARTIVIGLAILTTGCLVLWRAGDVGQLYIGTALAGAGFSLSANTPGVYLVSGWSGARAARNIGIYLMIGMAGNAVGPPVAQAIIAGIGWQAYWLTCAGVVVAMALVAAMALREPPDAVPDESSASWIGELRGLLASLRFILLALATVATQLCLVTVFSVAPSHLAHDGWPEALVARLLGIEGLASTVLTGVAARWDARRVLQFSLAAQALGMALLAWGGSMPALYGFAVLTGAGIGASTLAVTLLLVAYFGNSGGSAGLGAIWTLAGLAALGPWLAGTVADATGGYTWALGGLGALMVPVTGACLLLPSSSPA